ncbi:TetR family transcriptional regulator [Microbacterium album]|uniref:Transcriptional regulator, TetR family protein n=1 Tax=Microbacterium album TaxID=2053191 RepID=A0A917MK68_9MICO|nr:TetR family transcriptional regulator [Microbacterium album]GGH34990.1 putative transcriptional regulator, TetR family protein [Microbacterium album]
MPARDTPRTGRYDREAIVDTALRLLEETGLPDLSMRRLAAALGVQPSALYWHFENKQSLLAAVADRIVGSAAGAGRDPTAVALALRDALLSHRDGAEIVLSTYALGLASDDALSRLAAALERDVEPARARTAATVLLQFVLGHASLVQQRIQAARFGAYPAAEAEVARSTADEFAHGLRMLLAGLTAAPRG